MRVLEKTTENSERLSRQARPGIETGTSSLPALSAEPLCQWWGIMSLYDSGFSNFRIRIIAIDEYSEEQIDDNDECLFFSEINDSDRGWIY